VSEPETARDKRKFLGCGCLGWTIALVLLVFLAGIAIGPMPGGIKAAPESAAMQTSRQIGLMMFSYSNDHDQQYPDGKSSTEVFQQLLDGNYATDPVIFYLPMDGKIPPASGQKKLKPENVSWDVTGGLDSSSRMELPVVFMTGYKVSYSAGGKAVPLVKPYPRFGWVDSHQTWFDWLMGRPTLHYSECGGFAVMYKSNSATFRKLDTTANPDGSIPNFVSPDFKPDGKTYRQLTPEGVLP